MLAVILSIRTSRLEKLKHETAIESVYVMEIETEASGQIEISHLTLTSVDLPLFLN